MVIRQMEIMHVNKTGLSCHLGQGEGAYLAVLGEESGNELLRENIISVSNVKYSCINPHLFNSFSKLHLPNVDSL